MIIFTTDDNGMFHGSHGLAGKWYPYQESYICVPLIILYDPRMPKDKVGTIGDSCPSP
jgi:arylsulfatase A-like enzyme